MLTQGANASLGLWSLKLACSYTSCGYAAAGHAAMQVMPMLT